MNDTAKRVDDAIAAGAADAEIKRLAALPRLQYEHERKEAAEKLKVRAPILDKLVEGEKHSQALASAPFSRVRISL